MLLTPISTVYSQESSSDVTEVTTQLQQLESDFATKIKEATDLLYGNYYQAEELEHDISEIVPTGNERVTIIERGILAGGDNFPSAYWLIQVENISEVFLPSYSVLNYLTVQEETSNAVKQAPMRISRIDAHLMYKRPLEELDLIDRYAPGTIQHFRILVPLENPFAHYQLVSQLQDDTFSSEVFEDTTGNREIMIILEQPDINFFELDISEQSETVLTEINRLEAEL